MGFLSYSLDDIKNKVRECFGNTDNYLYVFNRDNVKKGLARFLLLGPLAFVLTGSQNYILNFNEKGIYEKNISTNLKGNFVLMPWHEIEDFKVGFRMNIAIIEFLHLGKKMRYEVPFKGRMCIENSDNLEKLQDVKWHQIENR